MVPLVKQTIERSSGRGGWKCTRRIRKSHQSNADRSMADCCHCINFKIKPILFQHCLEKLSFPLAYIKDHHNSLYQDSSADADSIPPSCFVPAVQRACFNVRGLWWSLYLASVFKDSISTCRCVGKPEIIYSFPDKWWRHGDTQQETTFWSHFQQYLWVWLNNGI